MGLITHIQWCDSSLNIQMGCEGCELVKGGDVTCYAKIMTDRYGGRKGWPDSFEQPKLFLHRLDELKKWPDLTGKDRPGKPWLNGMPRLVFLNDMGDTFTKGLPEDWFAEVLPILADTPHQYLVLTKWPNRFAKFSQKYPLPQNVWPGTSITSEKTVFRVKHLGDINGGGPKWLSVEPMLGIIDWYKVLKIPYINWMIIGGESGPKARPCKTQWIKESIAQCYQLEISPFVKQLGSKVIYHSKQIKLMDSNGGNWNEWPDEFLKVRKMPINL